MHLVLIRVHHPPYRIDHLLRQSVIQICHEHAILHSASIVLQRICDSVPPVVLHYVIAYDVPHFPSSVSFARNGIHGVPSSIADASLSTSLRSACRNERPLSGRASSIHSS